MDLLDWHRGRLSSRRLAVLVQHMPRDSALVRELSGEVADWGVTDYLLAHAVDQLQEANWMFATVNADEDSESLDYPEPVHRPGRPHEPDQPAGSAPQPSLPSPEELRRFFA
ncbi:hypothetical protein [Streptomyces sp. V3I7]|uniref:hypothetical protein n=1 Tax=Streptomyces sp. V3I7 TaxID=3042278 RepID=UPI002782BF3F|nr:hypothetical protein [Streptomyces sp. V3I7]MDQ0992030.1 hypothetical protein [Streptomyces sp. V3I7]